jgi:nitrate reductase delta subunit
MITKHPTDALGLLSALLHYPDDDFLGQLDPIEAAVADGFPGELKNAMEGFVGYLKAHTPIHLRECYTAAFDMNPSTTLNLTWHLHGDSEKRAEALARLQQIYEDAGWERTTAELPDFLPLMLEFLAVSPNTDNSGLIWQCLRGMDACINRLGQNAPAYANLLQPLMEMAATQLETQNHHALPVDRHPPERTNPKGA